MFRKRRGAMTKIYPLLLLMLMAVAPAMTEEKVVGGPFVVNAGQRSATVAWVVQTGEVTAGTAPGKVEKSEPVLRTEHIELTGLFPGRTYYYQAFPGEAGKGSFKTAPRDPVPFQFVVYGDVRTRHDVHKTVIDSILKQANPEFIVQT